MNKQNPAATPESNGQSLLSIHDRMALAREYDRLGQKDEAASIRAGIADQLMENIQ